MRYLFYIAICLLFISGCAKKQDDTTQTTGSSVSYQSPDTGESMLVIDVRTKQEYSSGHIKGAINISYNEIANKIENYTSDKNQKILLYCLSGSRSGVALSTLKKEGYTNVENIGSFDDAKAYFKSLQ